MVHVSAEAGGRQYKMLAFSPPTEPTSFTGIDSIIRGNSKEVVTFNDSSSSSPTTTTTATSNHHRTTNGNKPKTILNNTLNSLEKTGSPKYRLSDKMFAEEDNPPVANNFANNANNGNNANYILDSDTNANNKNNKSYDNHELDLISHGLTDSVCETIKLLESDYDNSKKGHTASTTTASSLSSGISASSSSGSGGMDEVQSNVVYTEEIVISTARSNSSQVTGAVKPGIMKTFSSGGSSSSASSMSSFGSGGGHGQVTHRNKYVSSTEQWKNQLNEEEEDEAMSQGNESEETPLLTGTENVSNEELPGLGTGAGNNAPSSAMHKAGKVSNGAKATGLKRVSFGSSKGSMVETLIYESPVSDEPGKSGKGGTLPILTNGTSKSASKGEAAQDSPDSNASGGSTGGSRPPSRVRVTFFESEKPLAVSSPESDIIDFDLSKMTIHGSPTVHDPSSPNYNRQISVEGWDNPFRPDGDLSKEADQIVELIKEGKPINDETLRSKSPSVNEQMNMSSSIPTQNQLNASPKGKEVNGSATNGTSGPVDIQHIVVAPAAQAGQVEHVVLKKKKGCCVIQ